MWFIFVARKARKAYKCILISYYFVLLPLWLKFGNCCVCSCVGDDDWHSRSMILFVIFSPQVRLCSHISKISLPGQHYKLVKSHFFIIVQRVYKNRLKIVIYQILKSICAFRVESGVGLLFRRSFKHKNVVRLVELLLIW